MQLSAAAVLGASLAACAGSSGEPPAMHVSAGVEAQTIQLAVNDIPPGREITELLLLAPDGTAVQARNRELITREESRRGRSGPGVGIGATGGSSSGINPFVSLGYVFSGGDTTRRSRRMTAEIPIPEGENYAADYRDWRIEVHYRDQLGEAQQVTVPAPAPR